MRQLYTLLFICFSLQMSAQEILPRTMTEEERHQIEEHGFQRAASNGIETPPDFSSLRTMAEWEEIQTITITWTGYPTILKQIARASKDQCEVLIITDDPADTETYLMSNAAGGPLDNMNNISLLEAGYNSVWIRDYGANTVYANGVDSLLLVDWIYNRPRPLDDVSPEAVADFKGIPLYTTTAAPSDLVNTGGNFMSDGFGTAFASELILEENEPNNPYDVTPKSEADIDNIMYDFMGIESFVKMETLPYDNIHHIDMHMKLLDEETLLVGEYPEGVADGPQINANIEYVLSNFNSMYDTPYEVVRIPMPDSPSGLYPDDNPSGYYRTYTNAVFVNETILVPTYREEYDTTALRIWEEQMPGYEIVGIDCDDQPDLIIAASGAIHCITKAIGVADPLLLSHQPLDDTDDTENDYPVDAFANHRDGVANASLFYRTDENEEYTEVEMTAGDENMWNGNIPAQDAGTTIEYYIQAESNSGKVVARPMVAPEGYWSFDVTGETINIHETNIADFSPAFPNPASAITCVPVSFEKSATGTIKLYDVVGKEIMTVHEGRFSVGESKYFFNASELETGAYLLVLKAGNTRATQRIMVK